jgi:hypothetical protein
LIHAVSARAIRVAPVITNTATITPGIPKVIAASDGQRRYRSRSSGRADRRGQAADPVLGFAVSADARALITTNITATAARLRNIRQAHHDPRGNLHPNLHVVARSAVRRAGS